MQSSSYVTFLYKQGLWHFVFDKFNNKKQGLGFLAYSTNCKHLEIYSISTMLLIIILCLLQDIIFGHPNALLVWSFSQYGLCLPFLIPFPMNIDILTRRGHFFSVILIKEDIYHLTTFMIKEANLWPLSQTTNIVSIKAVYLTWLQTIWQKNHINALLEILQITT